MEGVPGESTRPIPFLRLGISGSEKFHFSVSIQRPTVDTNYLLCRSKIRPR